MRHCSNMRPLHGAHQHLSPPYNRHRSTHSHNYTPPCNRSSYYSYVIALASKHSAKDSSIHAASYLPPNPNPTQGSTFQLWTMGPEVRRTRKTVRSRYTFPSYTAALPPRNPRQRRARARARARMLAAVAPAKHLDAFRPSRIPMPSILACPARTQRHLFPPTSFDSPPFCIFDFLRNAPEMRPDALRTCHCNPSYTQHRLSIQSRLLLACNSDGLILFVSVFLIVMKSIITIVPCPSNRSHEVCI